jgi:hypothetical protein
MINPKMKLGLDIRKEVLTTSIIVEAMTSAFLSALLGIKDFTKSRTLGNRGGSLSFNQKVDLLIEIGALSNENRSKYQAFMEVRNQFIHNLSASTYEKCFAATNGTDKYVLKTYPQAKDISREKQLEFATRKLSDDIAKLTVALTENLKEKAKKDAELEITKKFHQAFIDSIEQTKTSLDNFFDEEIKKNPNFSTDSLKGFGTEISKIIYALVKKNFEKLNSEKNETKSELKSNGRN